MSQIAFRFKVHTGPCGVHETAELIRGQKGFGFDVFEGTEHVYFSAFVNPDDYSPLGGPATFVAERWLKPLLGHAPVVVVFSALP